jgi:hypothetical protein
MYRVDKRIRAILKANKDNKRFYNKARSYYAGLIIMCILCCLLLVGFIIACCYGYIQIKDAYEKYMIDSTYESVFLDSLNNLSSWIGCVILFALIYDIIFIWFNIFSSQEAKRRAYAINIVNKITKDDIGKYSGDYFETRKSKNIVLFILLLQKIISIYIFICIFGGLISFRYIFWEFWIWLFTWLLAEVLYIAYSFLKNALTFNQVALSLAFQDKYQSLKNNQS